MIIHHYQPLLAQQRDSHCVSQRSWSVLNHGFKLISHEMTIFDGKNPLNHYSTSKHVDYSHHIPIHTPWIAYEIP